MNTIIVILGVAVFFLVITLITLYVTNKENNRVQGETKRELEKALSVVIIEKEKLRHGLEKEMEKQKQDLSDINNTALEANIRLKIEAYYIQYLLKQLILNWNNALVIKGYDNSPALRLSYNADKEEYDVKTYTKGIDVKDQVEFFLLEGPVSKLLQDLEAEHPIPLLSYDEINTRYHKL